MKKRMLFGMLVMALVWTNGVEGAYPANYVWNYGELFSTASPQGLADSQGNQVWRYCDSTDSTLPSAASLMGSCHSWETPATWQVGWEGGRFDQIGQQFIWANDETTSGIQVQWVAPPGMEGRVAVVFAFNGNNDVYNNVFSTFTVFKNDTQVSQVTQVGNYTYTGTFNVVPNDRISVRLVSGRWVSFSNFSATVTNIPAEPYPTGYVWNYGNLFSTSSAQGTADSHGNQVWRYCDSTNSTLPSAAPLMGSCHDWETPATWQFDWQGGHFDRIGQNRVWAEDDGVQIQWVAPAGMNGRVSVVFGFNGNNDGSNSLPTHFTVFKNDIACSTITLAGNYTYTGTFDVMPEDRISVRLYSPNRWIGFENFSSTVTVIAKDDYPTNHQWNFNTMFSATNPQGAADSKGNCVWRYCDSGSSSLPSEATLMGYYFSWENPANWRSNSSNIGGKDQIGRQWVWADDDGIQVQWVAPTGVGGRKVKAVFAFNGNNDGNHNVNSTFTVFKNDTQVSEVTQVDNYTYTGMFDVAVNDRISVRLVSGRWVAFANFDATITVAPVVESPVFTPSGPEITGATPVYISCPTGGTTIYYTINGETPTTSSQQYFGPVTVHNGTVLKAIAVGTETSWVTSQTYIGQPASTPIFTPGGKYISGPTSITITSTTTGADIYYTLNGETPTTGSSRYMGPVPVGNGTVLKAIAISENTSASPVANVTFIVPTSYNRPATIPAGTVVAVDGDLSDWAGATWTPMDQDYDSYADDITEASYSARWQADKIYLAVRVRDTAHRLMDTYGTSTDWNARDAIEIYLHTDNNDAITYPKATTAQQYIVGIKNSDHNAVWTAIGGASVATPLNGSNFSGIGAAAGRVDGEWLCYEVALTPYTYLGFLETGDLSTSMVSHLYTDEVIGLDVNAIAHNGSIFTGVKSENMLPEKYQNWEHFGLHKLVGTAPTPTPTPTVTPTPTPTPTRIPGDANGDNKVDVSDLGILAANYGGTGKTWALGDFSGDGKVDVSDLGILAAHYGQGSGGATQAGDLPQDMKALGLSFDSNTSEPVDTQKTQTEENPVAKSLGGCGSAGLPLILGLLLAGLMIGVHKVEE